MLQDYLKYLAGPGVVLMLLTILGLFLCIASLIGAFVWIDTKEDDIIKNK